MRGAVKITLDLRPSHLAARRLPFDPRPVLVGCPARILAVANHTGANDDQEFGAVDLVVLGARARESRQGSVSSFCRRYRARQQGSHRACQSISGTPPVLIEPPGKSPAGWSNDGEQFTQAQTPVPLGQELGATSTRNNTAPTCLVR